MRTSLLLTAIIACTLLFAPLRAAAQGTIFNPEVPDDKADATPAQKNPAKAAPASKPAAKGSPSDLLRPSTRGMLVSVGLGPAVELKGLPTQFKLEAAFAYHFSKGPTGLALGGVFGVAFGNQLTTIELGARVWWDFQPLAAYGLYIGPFAQAGWRFFSDHRCLVTVGGVACGDSTSDSYFGVALGVDARLLFSDRWFLLFRPAAFTLDFAGETASRYELVFGGGVTF